MFYFLVLVFCVAITKLSVHSLPTLKNFCYSDNSHFGGFHLRLFPSPGAHWALKCFLSVGSSAAVLGSVDCHLSHCIGLCILGVLCFLLS